MRFGFEWKLNGFTDGSWEVIERLEGTSYRNTYRAPDRTVAESIIKARRAFVHRTITTRTAAIQVFEPRPNLEALALLQAKGHLDS